MEKIRIKNLEEDVYYEKLDNGLEVYLYTKDDIYTNYVTFTTKYGSVYNDFVPIGESKIRSFPKGIAHFLEHKVFTEKEDPQPMEFFAKSGSLCNAYTTFRNTSYLFYATKDLKENIEYLLNYVQNIYLTEEDVEKEKGIISEEIHMYEDRPGDVLFEKVRLNTLNSSPYRNSIIGTVKDIESITKKDLETCYYTFYNPSNMFIVVTGSFDPEEIMSLIRENQSKKNFKIEDNIKVKEFKEEDKVFKEKEIIKMNTNIPKIAYTLKIPLKDIKLTRRQLHLYMYVLFTTLFDETSLFDEELKKDGIINNTTYVSLLNTNTHLLISLVNETNKYEEFLERLKDKLNNMEINEKDFKRKKKVLISNEIFAYENVENINDIIMDNNTDILLITGPNMAGKSTYMRQLGIIAIMAQIGCFVPAEEAHLPVFDKIFTRIGASDDLVSGESTFMVEMMEASRAIKNATKNSLILFDELGRGTATYDGMSLAEAILEYIANNIKCKTLFSTHYHELTSMENTLPNLKNKHVSAIEENGNITFLHKVKDGSVDKSYGINVATLAGLPKEVIDRANVILNEYESKDNNSKKDSSMQMMLPLNFEEKKSIVEEELKKIDVLNITPIEAINILNSLKEKIK